MISGENKPELVASICVTPAEGEPRVLQLRAGDSFRIGRVDSNDLVIAENKVSRFHAVLSVSASGVVVSDLNSLNGTLVNGRRIKLPQSLATGDVLEVGDSKIVIHLTQPTVHDEESTMVTRTLAAQLQAAPLTVLVADVCGYTRIFESLPAVQVADMLKLWCEMVSDIVHKHDGEVDKFIGDCVMAIWRDADKGPKWGAAQALDAALDIHRETLALGNSGIWPYGDLHPWTCRQAVNSGEALFGSVTERGRRDFTVVGDTINVTFRLQGLTGKLDKWIITSESTVKLLDRKFSVESLGSVPVEGRLEELNVYALAVE